MLRLPATPGELDADWFAAVLGQAVRSCRLLDTHAGTTGRAVVALEYAVETDLPRHLFVKLPPGDELQRAFVTSSGMGRREARFYRELAQELPLRIPCCYYADWDDTGEHYIMLLEQLEDSGCTFRNASTHYSLDYAKKVLAAFARLHAQFWRSPRFSGDLEWLEPPLQHAIAVDLIDSALLQFAADMPPTFSAMAELYLDRADDIHALWQRGDPTLVHGDAHDANLFMAGAEPGFLDWALVARAPAMRDVGYFLAATLDPQDQRAHGFELLEYYAGQLRAAGVETSLADLQAQYRWHAAYVWVGAVVTLAMGDAWQPQAYVLSSLERLHPALESLGTVEAIRESL